METLYFNYVNNVFTAKAVVKETTNDNITREVVVLDQLKLSKNLIINGRDLHT